MIGTVTITFSAIVGPTLRRLHEMLEKPFDRPILDALAMRFGS